MSLIRLCLAVVALTFAACFAGSTATAATACDLVASPSGSDSAAGTPAAPFRTAQRLVDRLAPGVTGCLAAGATFNEDLRMSQGGAPGRPAVLTSAPGGAPATLRGRLWVRPPASDLVVSELSLDGRNPGALASPEIAADRVTFDGNRVTNGNTGICFLLGKTEDPNYDVTVNDVVISGNRIFGCGVLPSTNGDHGIYVESSRNAHIVDNYIYDNADRGVQLFPDAVGTVIEYNVMDGNGESSSVGGWHGFVSRNNVLRKNVMSNPTQRHNFESFWDSGASGTGNRVEDNCFWKGKGTYGDVTPPDGFSLARNITADPQFTDRAAKDFRLPDSSACAGKGARAVPGPGTPGVPAAAGTPASGGLSAARGARIPSIVRRPRIAGVPLVGTTVTCAKGRWKGSPTGYRYRWLRNGKRIRGASQRRYRIRPADAERIIRCVVQARSNKGRRSVASARLKAFSARSRPVLRSRPKVVGARAGGRAVCRTGSWGSASKVVIRVRWVVDGRVVRSAVAKAFEVRTDAAGAKLRCEVRARNGNGVRSALSAAATAAGG